MRSLSRRYLATMASCVSWSTGGYLSRSRLIFSRVTVSRWAIPSSSSADDTEVTDAELDRPSSAPPRRRKVPSKTGDASRELDELASLPSAASALSEIDLNLPPWIGGMKFVHRPWILPMRYLFICCFVSAECRLYTACQSTNQPQDKLKHTR